MQEEEVKRLLEKFKAGKSSEEELILINYWLHKFNEEGASGLSKPDLENAHEDIWNSIKYETKPSTTYKNLMKFVTIAAIVIALVAISFIFFKSNTTILPSNYANDIAPGANKATLTLAQGKIINLNGTKSGIVIDASRLLYNDGTDIDPTVTPKDNITLHTPNGGQYQVKLPDGTKVWLNAASTLKFPTTFITTANRKVELIGEAYFEVKRDKAHPFIVMSNNQEIEVLGTHFNVSSYLGEPVKTTLVEGSVKINKQTILTPGDQSVNTDQAIKVTRVDTDIAIAWKNGDFMFRNEALESIMQKVARWYDVDVSYEDDQVGKKPFGGTISRSEKISDVLSMLELTGEVHFKIDGRKIQVSS